MLVHHETLIQYFVDQDILKDLGNKRKNYSKHLVGPTTEVEFPPVTVCWIMSENQLHFQWMTSLCSPAMTMEWKTWGGTIRNRMYHLGESIRNCPCILKRTILNRRCSLGGNLRNSCLAKLLQSSSLIRQPIHPFTDKFRQELLLGCIRLRPMWCPTKLSPFRTD